MTCFQQSANLSEEEKSLLYYICGYVTYKEDLPSADGEQDNISSPESEFLRNISRVKLCYPSEELYYFSQYVFFKERKNKCCRKSFVQACREIFEFTGYHFPNIDKIYTRLVNCFFQGFVKMSDNIKVSNDHKNECCCCLYLLG